MDWSDEKYVHAAPNCVTDTMNIFCDDHKCPQNWWSCGDGQCIAYTDRIIYKSQSLHGVTCFSMREFSHMCELSVTYSLWTKSDGLCVQSGYEDTSLRISSDDDRCLYLIRCALSKGAEINCLCNEINCTVLMQHVCDTNSWYPYPSRKIIRPWLRQLFSWNRTWINKMPTVIYFDGTFRCRGYAVVFTLQNRVPLTFHDNLDADFENNLCHKIPLRYRNFNSPYQYSLTCWNNSMTFNEQPYAFVDICPEANICFSQYRIADGSDDCPYNEDETNYMLNNISYCQNIRQFRFQCSVEQRTCLPISQFALPSRSIGRCQNTYDRRIKGHGQYLADIRCDLNTNDNDCRLLRYYIGNSSILNSTFTDTNNNHENISTIIPFKNYCDTFWDESGKHNDENAEFCQTWICYDDQFRCRTGQCIPIDWVCDGEWDCSDASDEFGLSAMCYENYKLLPFRDLCNFTHEFPCYRADVPHPLNISAHRPCINITQIGDGIVDCYGGIDEKNTLEDCAGQMLGYTLRCDEGCTPYIFHCQDDFPCRTSLLCSYKNRPNSSWCNDDKDAICLNGSCARNARCDGKYQCLHGEDEHWCLTSRQYNDHVVYRYLKLLNRNKNYRYTYGRTFPEIYHLRKRRNVNIEIHPQFVFWCNRGFPFYEPDQSSVSCACPPAYYGSRCEYFSDRISVITHLDLSTFPIRIPVNLLTIVVHLDFTNIIIDQHVFHVNPSLEMTNPIKHRFFLLYSRLNTFLEHKRVRYFNRHDLINSHPYSVHFDIFALTNNQTIIELGSFQYPIYFDFLPAFRLAPVLKFPSWFSNRTHDPCTNHTCNANSTCKPIFNRNQSSYYCSCKSDYSGTNCEHDHHSECLSYCSSKSICRPKFRGIIGSIDHPLCICPLNHFGPRCYLKNEACQSNPCGPNSTCHITYDPSGEKPFICFCSEQFFGDHCQYEKLTINIRINLTLSATVSNIQFYDLIQQSNSLLLYQQQIKRGLSNIVRYNHAGKTIPSIGILKIYEDLLEPEYFLLYFQSSDQSINLTVTPQKCPHTSQDSYTIFQYHQICKNNSKYICFHDSIYFCICNIKNMAECYEYNSRIDHCDQCFAGGRCLSDTLEQTADFICICPHCTQGSRCEFSLQAFGFTLDSLLISDSNGIQYVYLSLTIIIFLFGFFNNCCSFTTFKRKQPRQTAVGNYLLFVTIFSQLSLFILLLKLITIVLGSIGGIASHISCKIISYLLSVSTRSTYWLTSWITISRLLIILYPTSPTFKNPRLAIFISLCTCLILLVMHIHELIFYQIIQQTICVTHFHHSTVAIYNRINTSIHYLLPFSIQIICTIYLLILTSRSRARVMTAKKTFQQIFRKQISAQKELFITPTIIILSALPQIILSFTLACSQLHSWQRHILLITILLSSTPQVLGFILYVLPSSAYKKEFGQTAIGRQVKRRNN